MSGGDFFSSPKSGAIKIIHEPSAAEPFVVLEKSPGLPSAPLVPGDESALTECGRLFPKVLSVRGKKSVEGGLVHRIDTGTSGLLLIAQSQEFYEHILAAQAKGLFIKGYRAESDIDQKNAEKLGGFPKSGFTFPLPQNLSALRGFSLESCFRPFGKGKKEVRPVLQSSNAAALKKMSGDKVYSTKIVAAKQSGGGALLECKITQGYRHQVRAHLAWLGLPVKGDALYNADFRMARERGAEDMEMSFKAVSLEFPDCFSDKVFRFSLD